MAFARVQHKIIDHPGLRGKKHLVAQAENSLKNP